MSKRNIKNRLLSALAASALAAASVFALPGCALGREITVTFNGEELEFSQAPKIVDGTTMVPMRQIFEELGMTVSWNGGSSTVTAVKNGKSAVITVGSKTARINGEAVELAAAPENENGTVMVPLRVISEAVGVNVEWNDSAVTLTKTEGETDDSWKNNTGEIDLSSMTVSGNGLAANGKVITVTQGGDFTVSGTCGDGMIYINTDSRVKLRLSGVNLANQNGPAIFFDNCDKGFITISKGTENYLADGGEYAYDAKGTIFANDDLEIKGQGTLTVVSSFNHGIVSDDKIKIEEGTINITAAGDGIHANDGVEISGGNITVSAVGDGIDSENYVLISGGEIDVTTSGEVAESGFGGGFGGFSGDMGGGRGMGGKRQDMQPGGQDGENPPLPPEGQGLRPKEPPENMGDRRPPEFDGENPPQPPENGGEGFAPPQQNGESGQESSLPSTKGIKAETNLIVSGGDIRVNSADHALHSAGIVFINGGAFSLASQKGKGISAHTDLVIDGGEITVSKSTEGIESKGAFCVNGGTVKVTASDDGLNAGGTDGRDVGGGNGHDMYINGGYICVDSAGDGVDANGIIYSLGGTVIVNGPTNSGNGALDSGGSIAAGGGTLIAVGSSGMAEYPRASSSTQPALVYSMEQAQAPNTVVRIEDSDGKEIITYRPSKTYQSIVFSSPELEIGKAYRVILGGEYSGGSDADGILTEGSFSGGAEAASLTLESMTAVSGSGGGRGMGGMGRR